MGSEKNRDGIQKKKKQIDNSQHGKIMLTFPFANETSGIHIHKS
jgi:hypothetical protein